MANQVPHKYEYEDQYSTFVLGSYGSWCISWTTTVYTLISFPRRESNYERQSEKFIVVWLPYLALMNEFELAIPWWLEKRDTYTHQTHNSNPSPKSKHHPHNPQRKISYIRAYSIMTMSTIDIHIICILMLMLGPSLLLRAWGVLVIRGSDCYGLMGATVSVFQPARNEKSKLVHKSPNSPIAVHSHFCISREEYS